VFDSQIMIAKSEVIHSRSGPFCVL